MGLWHGRFCQSAQADVRHCWDEFCAHRMKEGTVLGFQVCWWKLKMKMMVDGVEMIHWVSRKKLEFQVCNPDICLGLTFSSRM